MASIAIVSLRPKGGDLKLVVLLNDHHHAKLSPHGDGSIEQPLNLFGTRAGSHIIITWLAA
jgi:hypothetical protein